MFEATDKGLGNEQLRRQKHVVGGDVTGAGVVAKNGGECFFTDFVSDVSMLIDNARAQYPDAKVACVGHSQGTQNLYSFFFNYPGNIDCFVSMGSPISMTSWAYPDYGRVPKNLGSWINFYHRMDFVSSKLQGCHLSKEIADFVVDYEVPSAWWKVLYRLPNWWVAIGAGIASHTFYWKSDFVAKRIAGKIRELMFF